MMCKQEGRTFCTELGPNVSLWSTEAPLPKPSWIEVAFSDFLNAIGEAKSGNVEVARDGTNQKGMTKVVTKPKTKVEPERSRAEV